MKILVTGGAGFIASHVTDAYLAAGHDVVVLDNLYTGKLENLNPGCRFIEMDIRDRSLEKFMALEKFDVVNHHAAQVSVPASVQDPVQDLEVNGQGTLNLMQSSAKAGVGRFIFISSGGAIYGEQEVLPIKEETWPKPESPYAVHKMLGETYLPFFRDNYGMEYVVLRYANIYGPRQAPHAEAGVVAIFTEALLAKKDCTVYRFEEQPKGMVRDYLYVGDAARANLLALEKGQGQTVNLGTEVATHTLDLLRAVGKACGVKPVEQFGPARKGDLKRSLLECSLAQKALGWQAETDLDKGLEMTVQWYRNKA
ncbi:NAD-dependent epimerase/dehydratase family protein [Dethiosulfatarculus sandiegensis]|uniref:UDP-glucose 4-epimerase n=1 Tax=Dethiosulfatarculus sandiegensis TaxID=1429043 RepID=A0A0D2J5D8_9BACT|nr:NAD-dependent epimerase/dehydratase family protein [Dethiosulfatarculus sandiegensis]KIX13334.1 UDP-glucose 4-epimerase [Dethiosulfatarculus sandiegensis]